MVFAAKLAEGIRYLLSEGNTKVLLMGQMANTHTRGHAASVLTGSAGSVPCSCVSGSTDFSGHTG